MRVIPIFFSLFIVLLICSPFAWCHGVKGRITQTKGYLVTAEYDDGEPMSYSELEIKSSYSDLPFQTGRTDRNGCIMFKPDRPGKWQVVVNDGMGHRMALDLEVEQEENDSQNVEVLPQSASGTSNRMLTAITGLSVIFGLSGIVFGFKARRLARSDQR